MKILAYKGLTDEALKKLKEIGTVVSDPLDSEKRLMEEIKDAEVLVIRSKPHVTKKAIEAAKKLKVIGRPGVSISNVDKDAVKLCKERGIKIVTTPEATTTSVAELTIGLAISLLRNIPKAHNSVKRGEWDRKKFLGRELFDKKWAIFGLGRIGREVAQKLTNFGCNLYAYDPYCPKEVCEECGALKVEHLDDFLPHCEILSIHAPLTPKTRHTIDEAAISKMPDGAYIINIARGEIIDEKALVKALKSGKLAGAALDVYGKEPPGKGNPLLKLDNVVLTPHQGANTEEAQKRAIDGLIGKIKSEVK